jgi:hypothetical protein
VVLIAQDNIGDVCDCASVVCGAVDIVDRDRISEGTCGDVIELRPLDVDEAARACVRRLTAVFVDSISTSTARDISPGLTAMTYLTGNRRSQAGRQLCQFGMGEWEGVCTTSVLLRHMYEIL